MNNKQFFNNLSATYADVRKLDVKKINLKGKNILDYIKESVPVITHSQDTRETVYADDLWGQWVETKNDGTVIIHDDYLSNPNGTDTWTPSAWLSNVKAVQDNKAYTSTDASGEPLCNIQTEMIKDGSHMFYNTYLTLFDSDLSSLVTGSGMFSITSLESFNGDLSNLVDGNSMFSKSGLESFDGDLSSLVNGSNMFFNTRLTSFSGDLSSLVNGNSMFSTTSPESSTTSLESFSGDLSSLVTGSNMFSNTRLTSFSGDLSSLVNGSNMFFNTRLTSFSGDLSSLVNGNSMFSITSLTPQSVMYIVESIRNIPEEKAKYTIGEIPWVTYDSTTRKYSAPFGFMEDGKYVYTYKNPNPYTTTISSLDVGKLTLGINVTNNSNTIDQQLQTFAEGCLCDSWAELKQEFSDKGWTVTFQYGGTTDVIPDEFPNT